MSVHHVRPTCSHCVYWVGDHTVGSSTVGHCHRFPPGIYVHPESGTVVQKFPSTDHHRWCGEWTDDESSLLEAAKRSVVGVAAAARKPEASSED